MMRRDVRGGGRVSRRPRRRQAQAPRPIRSVTRRAPDGTEGRAPHDDGVRPGPSHEEDRRPRGRRGPIRRHRTRTDVVTGAGSVVAFEFSACRKAMALIACMDMS